MPSRLAISVFKSFSFLGYFLGCRLRPAKSCTFGPSSGDASFHSLPQNLPFELCERRPAFRQGASCWRSQVESFGERDETMPSFSQDVMTLDPLPSASAILKLPLLFSVAYLPPVAP